MFNYVKFKANCWKCGVELREFQTKDGGELAMKRLLPKAIGNGNLYTSCDNCNAWNEWQVIPKEVEVIFDEKESKLRTE